MTSMRRRDLVKLAVVPAVLTATPNAISTIAQAQDASNLGVVASGADSTVNLTNREFQLSLTPGDGVQCQLLHVPSGTILADGNYSYSFGHPTFSEVRGHGDAVVIKGKTDTGLAIEHRFTVPKASPWIEESIKLTNSSASPIVLPLRCGFVLPVRKDTLKNYVFSAIPNRLEHYARQAESEYENVAALARRSSEPPKRYSDYSLTDVLYRRRTYLNFLHEGPQELQTLAARRPSRRFSDDYASEAWVVTDGQTGFVISKYNQLQWEEAMLDRVYLPHRVTGLRWGGGSTPEISGSIHLAPGESREFGITRLSVFKGDLVRGCYVFRAEMEARGHGAPENFDPPVHWNELYDNKLWVPGNVEAHIDPNNREKYFRLANMKEEAAKAQAMGCDALYLDPGWDTPQSSKLWDESRLGRINDFIAMLEREYGGLKLSLHTPLSWWTGRGCDLIPNTALVNAEGAKTHYACGASRQYIEETVHRLRDLADAGVCFFMFDGAHYRGECWDTTHGHAVPSTLDEHLRATNQLAKMVHQTHPHVLIELHDQAWTPPYWVPLYLGHGVDASGVRGFDERWAFEFMWNPMEDLLTGNSIALYYYNLAYSLPLYLHINLKTDNGNALVFWWTASTCRHLGIGGTHADPTVIESHKRAMKTYKRLKPFYSAGAFYGIDELTHVHSAKDGKSAVINCFNLGEQSVDREVRFDPAQFGLVAGKSYQFSGAPFKRAGKGYVGSVSIPSRGHTLIEVI